MLKRHFTRSFILMALMLNLGSSCTDKSPLQDANLVSTTEDLVFQGSKLSDVYNDRAGAKYGLSSTTLRDASILEAGSIPTWDVKFSDHSITDTKRMRDIAYRVYYPVGLKGNLPLAIFSHGGDGATDGHKQLGHFGMAWASAGIITIHLNHLSSETIAKHLSDRPADVTFILDRLQDRSLPLPSALNGVPDLTMVAHAGHSWGAYTSHAVGGAVFSHGTFKDGRIKAIIPISPQGPDGFGAYDQGPNNNSWQSITIPAFNLVGSLEKNGPLGDPNKQADWRLFPFNRYPVPEDKYLSIILGQNHGDMANGSVEVKSFITKNTTAFLLVYLSGQINHVCEIGFLSPLSGNENRRKFDPQSGFPRNCPAAKP